MFGLWQSRNLELIDHWYVLLPDFQTSTSEFYEAIRQELTERGVPGMEVSTVLFPEGGALSARREYLRLRRERLVFDVCSATFGNSGFFSCRFAQIPFSIRIWELLVMLALLTGTFFLYIAVFGIFWGVSVASLSLIAVLFLLNNVVAMGFYDLDAVLLKIPVLGAFYEVFLRRNTYYREDSRLMYCDLVNRIVRDKVEEFAGAHDITKVEFKKNEIPPRMGFRGLMRDLIQRLCHGSTTH